MEELDDFHFFLVLKMECVGDEGLSVKHRENPIFLKNGKMVISVKIQIFLDLG